MFAFRCRSVLSRLHFLPKPTNSFFPHSTYLSSIAIESSTLQNPIVYNYLIDFLRLPEANALKVSNQWSHVKSTEKPRAVVDFFRSLGFSNKQIQSVLMRVPQFLFSDVEKRLKPKVAFFQDLGLSGPQLRKFITKNPVYLKMGLDMKLKPRVELISKVLQNGKNQNVDDVKKDLLHVLSNSDWLVTSGERKLLANISYLKHVGIVGSQLACLMKRRSRVFIMRESELRDRISKALDMGFTTGSRMLVYGVMNLYSVSAEAFCRKKELFQSFGFSEMEFMQMIRVKPFLLGLSKETLKSRFEFFLYTVKLNKLRLVRRPVSLCFSMEKRVMPRYRVLEIIKSKGLLEKEPKFLSVIALPDVKFLENYVSRFTNDMEDLLAAYKGNISDSSTK